MVTDEVDANILGKFEFSFSGVGDADVGGEELVEAVAALGEFLRIDENGDGEVVAGHRPAIAAVVATFEGASGGAGGPANAGQIFLLGVA